MAIEKSETLIVPKKSGNSPHEDPAEEGVSGLRDPREGKVTGTLCSGDISTKFGDFAKSPWRGMRTGRSA